MYRQGDVLLIPVDEATGEVLPRTGRIVLAEGEATGHAHAIYDDGAELLIQKPTKSRAGEAVDRIEDNVVFLRCRNPVSLRHEEHNPISLPAGLYRVIRQREYSPEEIRRVAD